MARDKTTFEHYGTEFQKRIIAEIISDKRFAESILPILSPGYFKGNIHLSLLVAEIVNAFKDEVILDYETLQNRLLNHVITENEKDREEVLALITDIRAITLNDSEYTQETAMLFCKQQEMSKTITDIKKIIDRGNIEEFPKCEELIRKALELGGNKDNGVHLLDSIDSVLEDDFRKPISTGIDGLDECMDGGLSKGELAVILAATGVGKAQPLTSKILTPNGWTTMGEIKIGDEVISRDGKATKVLGVYPQGIRPIYKVSFTDNTSTLCDEEHLWAVNSGKQRDPRKNRKGISKEKDLSYKPVATKDLINNLTKHIKNPRYNYRIPNVSPVEFTKTELTVDPYLLGLIIGDGSLSGGNCTISTKDDFIVEEVSRIYKDTVVKNFKRKIEKTEDDIIVLVDRELYGLNLNNGMRDSLRDLNLLGKKSDNKFIPKNYLYNSVENRVALLQGLVDSDGYIDGHRIEISTVSKELSEDIRELVLSLGGKIHTKVYMGAYRKNGIKKETKEYYRIGFSLPDNGIIPARLPRKLERFNPRTKYAENKMIKSIEYSHDELAQCIMVDNPEHLYVTDDYIVTHNTTLVTKLAQAAYKQGKVVVQIFFEDTIKIIQRKHLACHTGIALNDLSSRKEEVKASKVTLSEEHTGGKLIMKRFPSGTTTIPMIKQYLRKLTVSGIKPDMILLDYIDCVQSTRHSDDISTSEGQTMREFESLISEIDVAGWVCTQANRSAVTSDIVEANQMGGSFKKAQIGHFIMSIAKKLDQRDEGTASIAILKSRFGKDGITFPDSIFNNATMHIELKSNGGLNFGGMMNKKKEDEQNRVNLALRTKQAVNKLTENKDKEE